MVRSQVFNRILLPSNLDFNILRHHLYSAQHTPMKIVNVPIIMNVSLYPFPLNSNLSSTTDDCFLGYINTVDISLL